MQTRWLLLLSASVLLAFPTRAATEAQRRDHLDWVLKNLPDAPAWRDYGQGQSGSSTSVEQVTHHGDTGRGVYPMDSIGR